MNKSEEIKQLLTPTQVIQHYLGQPLHRDSSGVWYKSPFRNERTASFLVSDEKGMHDFGTSKHYDIINFIEEYFRVDFKTAIQILSKDFGIPMQDEISEELKEYLKKRRQEEKEIQYAINVWFNNTFSQICDELFFYEKAIKYLKQEALAIAYKTQTHLEYLVEIFINAITYEQKIELYQERETIEKWLNLQMKKGDKY